MIFFFRALEINLNMFCPGLKKNNLAHTSQFTLYWNNQLARQQLTKFVQMLKIWISFLNLLDIEIKLSFGKIEKGVGMHLTMKSHSSPESLSSDLLSSRFSCIFKSTEAFLLESHQHGFVNLRSHWDNHTHCLNFIWKWNTLVMYG